MNIRFTYNDGGRSAAGFKGTAGDCVARAIAIASRRPYAEIYKRLALGNASVGNKRSARNGVDTKAVWFQSYMYELNFEWIATTRHLSADELPAGRIICDAGTHYVAVIDGIIHDTADCSRYGTRCVVGYWRQRGTITERKRPTAHGKMVDRVRALLAKTIENGCTEAEAMAAIAKAAEIMAAHDIAESDLKPHQDEDILMRPTGSEDPYKVRWNICNAIARFAHCRSWRNSYSHEIIFFGLESDVVFAEWLLITLSDFVLREIERHLADRRNNGLSCSRTVSASFMHGITDRISERLCAFVEQPAGKELVVLRNARVDAAMERAGIKVRTSSSSYFNMAEESYAAGAAAGNRASFARPVSGAGATLRIGMG